MTRRDPQQHRAAPGAPCPTLPAPHPTGDPIQRERGGDPHMRRSPATDRILTPGECDPAPALRGRIMLALRRGTVAILAAGVAAAACDSTAEGRTPPQESAPESPALAVPAAHDSDDPAVREALAALAAGRPYRATRLLQPALASPARRTPGALLLAATAASEWGGWSTIPPLLQGERWLDEPPGEGRELLARAALATARNADATTEAARAVTAAASDSARGVRLTLLARALDRRDVLDSAATAYMAAAPLLPRVADWLRLRAAGVTTDSAARAAILASVTDTLARQRAATVEAMAMARAGDTLAAAGAYARAGDRATSLRLRARIARDSAARTTVRRELLALVTESRGSPQARAAAGELAATFAPLDRNEALAVARTLSASGPLATAADAYARAAALGEMEAADQFSRANVLFRLGRNADAATQFARVPISYTRAGDAAYDRARALLRAGKTAESRAVLRGIEQRHPRDTVAIGNALYLLSDLATDEGRDAAARATFRYLVERYPTSPMAPRAAFQAAMIAMADGDHRAAARELDSLAHRYPRAADAIGATYWAGRAWRQGGDSAMARARWESVLTREPLSYYAVLAARRLGSSWWSPAAAGEAPPASPAAGTRFASLDLLEILGFDPEAARERDRISLEARSSPDMLAIAEAFEARGRSTNGIALGNRALAADATRDARLYRVIYPVVHADVLAAESRAHDLDPALVAALIRQESSFLATALSPAGARGLMQLMPAVGRSVGQAAGITPWNDALLYQPDVNIQLGTTHLASLVARYDALPHVLAAYNAGASRVTRWREKGGAADPELFTERIPFAETRDYVRIVTRNREIYRVLYGW